MAVIRYPQGHRTVRNTKITIFFLPTSKNEIGSQFDCIFLLFVLSFCLVCYMKPILPLELVYFVLPLEYFLIR